MAKNNQKKKVPKQSWEPNGWLKLLHGLWTVLISAVKIIVGALATVICIVVVCGVVFVGLLANYLENDVIPNADYILEGIDLDQTSSLYAVNSDGQIEMIQQVYTTVDRQWVSIDEIPEDLIHAAVAIEDKRFYEHQGVDWITTVKACANMFFGGSTQFGGSTITQQLLKNVTGEDSVTVQRKVIEIFRAQQLERRYDKDTIMEWYLNMIYLGEGCYGVKSAAATYFGKNLQDLTIAECASLVSITKNPYQYDPYRASSGEGKPSGRERNRERQLDVLQKMLEQGWITEAEYNEAVSQTMIFKNGIDEEDRIATCPNTECGYTGTLDTLNYEDDGYYHCPVCGTEIPGIEKEEQQVYSYFAETVLEDVAQALAERDGQEWNDTTRVTYLEIIKRGGYHIFTTLDPDVQAQVDEIYTDLSKIPATRDSQQLQSAIVVIDNQTGDIVAMAGGVGEKTKFFGSNRATHSTLQTGSSFKPLAVYAPAFEVGAITPATVVKDLPQSYTEDGTPFPRNSDRIYKYARTVYDGVTSSVNSIAVNTLESIGLSYSYHFAKDIFGISTLTDSYVNSKGQVFSDVNYSPLALGTQTLGVTVRDMAAAYASFANDGYYRNARTFTKVYNSKGELILDNTQEGEQILSQKTVDYMNYCLNNAVNNGTGTSAILPNMTVAGKTGTTSDNTARWFCGYTGYYTAAVWCGYDQPATIHLTGNTKNPASRLWKMVMEPLHEGKADVPLFDTSKMVEVTVCLDSGKLATDACYLDVRGTSRTSTVLVYEEDVPTELCDHHVTVDYCVTGNGVANEYCYHFANAGAADIQEKSLVKMTQSMIEEIRLAGECGLESVYVQDKYIYLVDSMGHDMSFRGINGNINTGINAPYAVCTTHTKAAWDAYCAQHPGATEPEEPEDPIFPGFDWPW